MKKNLKYLFIILAIVIFVLFMVLSNAFGFFEYFKKGINLNQVTTSNVIIEVDDNSSLEISKENAFPVSDEVGRSFTPYTFDIKNTGSPVTYQLKIVKDTDAITADHCSDNLMPDASLRYQLIKNGSIVGENLLSNLTNYVIDTASAQKGETVHYELRIWIDKAAGIEVMNKHFHGKVEVTNQ